MENNIHRNLYLGGISVVLGVAFMYLLKDESYGINFPLFVSLILLGAFIIAKNTMYQFNTQERVLFVLALFFSVMVFVRSSLLLTFFNVLGTFLLLAMATRSKFRYVPEDYLKVFFIPFRYFRPLRTFLAEVCTLQTFHVTHPRTREVIRGTGIAVLAVLFFTLLFSSADPFFEKVVTQLFSFTFPPDITNNLIVTIVVSLFFIGAFAYAFNATTNDAPVRNTNIRSLGVTETTIVLGSITCLFLVFIILQISYLFGGDMHLASQGITYADYARSGFVELLVVAIASYIIIAFAERRIVTSSQTHVQSFKIFSSILVGEVLLILISAFERLSLYEEAYGFTTIRLYSHALMIWIGIMLILLSHHILKNTAREKFGLYAFSSVVLLLISMNALNPDAFIAQKNMERYKATGTIDTEYLAYLSDDALPYTIHLLDDPSEQIRTDFWNAFYWAHDINQKKDSWKSFHLSEQKAESLRNERY